MKIGQILFENAPFYEQKSQRLDSLHLEPDHEVKLWVVQGTKTRDWTGQVCAARQLSSLIPPTGVRILHVYGPRALPADIFGGMKLNYVATGKPPSSRLPWRKTRGPAASALPYGPDAVAEAVEAGYFLPLADNRAEKPRYRIGTLARGREVAGMVEATRSRLVRFRDDLEWQLWMSPPSPNELAGVDVWVDPGYDEADLSGWVAEAMVCGVPVVATRTRVNQERLLGGEAGFLVRPRDPNELTHAIATALFKPELSEPRRTAALRKRDLFRGEHRVRELVNLYRSLTA